MHAINKVGGLFRHLEGRPAHLLDIGVGKSDAHVLADILKAFVSDRRPDAIEPGALVDFARHGEGSSAQLFGVQTKRRHLKKIRQFLIAVPRVHAFHLVGPRAPAARRREARKGKKRNARKVSHLRRVLVRRQCPGLGLGAKVVSESVLIRVAHLGNEISSENETRLRERHETPCASLRHCKDHTSALLKKDADVCDCETYDSDVRNQQNLISARGLCFESRATRCRRRRTTKRANAFLPTTGIPATSLAKIVARRTPGTFLSKSVGLDLPCQPTGLDAHFFLFSSEGPIDEESFQLVTKDAGVRKSVVRPGQSGKSPQEGDSIFLKYVLRLGESEEIVDVSQNDMWLNKEFKFVAGNELLHLHWVVFAHQSVLCAQEAPR